MSPLAQIGPIGHRPEDIHRAVVLFNLAQHAARLRHSDQIRHALASLPKPPAPAPTKPLKKKSGGKIPGVLPHHMVGRANNPDGEGGELGGGMPGNSAHANDPAGTRQRTRMGGMHVGI